MEFIDFKTIKSNSTIGIKDGFAITLLKYKNLKDKQNFLNFKDIN